MACHKSAKNGEHAIKHDKDDPSTNIGIAEALEQFKTNTELTPAVLSLQLALNRKDEAEVKTCATTFLAQTFDSKHRRSKLPPDLFRLLLKMADEENLRQQAHLEKDALLVTVDDESTEQSVVGSGPANTPFTSSGDLPTGNSSAELEHDVNVFGKDIKKRENEQEVTEVKRKLIETLEENRALNDKVETQRKLIEDRAIEHKNEIEKLLEEKTIEHKNQIEKLLGEQAFEHKKEIDKLLEHNGNLQTGIAKAQEEKVEECKMLKEQHEWLLNDLEKKHGQEMERKNYQLSEMKKERDDMKTRFSKLAGSKLTDQNADIADLSDPFRALKLSEKFGALYDDEWTDAFLDLKKIMTVKDAITLLIKLLKDCLGYCAILSDEQIKGLKNVLLHPSQNKLMDIVDPSKPIKGVKHVSRIGSKDEGAVYDVRRKIGITECVLSEVVQGFIQETKSWGERGYDKGHIEMCMPYLKKCAEICWLMTIHCPPLYIKLDVQHGDILDLNYFSNYKTQSKEIDYLVWPPLFNEKNGGLLKKGVAEGKATEPEK